jgi:hypothetical protein
MELGPCKQEVSKQVENKQEVNMLEESKQEVNMLEENKQEVYMLEVNMMGPCKQERFCIRSLLDYRPPS